MAEALRVENLYVRFGTQQGQVKALNGVSLEQEEGQVFCLVGESGAGKSTLALAIMDLLPTSATVESGSVLFDGVDLLRASPEYVRGLRGKEISMVFQDAQSALNLVHLVGDQLEEVILAHTNVSARVANRMGQEMLREMGLADPSHIMDQYPFSLSGGMCQRVMLAIGLVLGPRLLIADEPTSGLDVTVQAEILELLRRMCREQHASILLITHDMGVVATMAHQVGVIYAGTMVETAEVIPLFKQPQHPYTWALLQALPRLDEPSKRLQPLPGNPPDMVNLPEECPFLPRCHKALSHCRATRRPALEELGAGHWVACYNPVVARD
jgi:oligopeptide/dipeptide ABC transporter ATP-binding protein